MGIEKDRRKNEKEKRLANMLEFVVIILFEI